MAYDKHDWTENELITAGLLDHIEQGIYDAYNRAERSIEEIIDQNPDLNKKLAQRIQDLLLEIDEENKKLIFKVTDTRENT